MRNKNSNKSIRPLLYSSFLIALLAALLAFLTRSYQLENIQYKFDDWLGAFHPGPPLFWGDGLSTIVWQIHETSRHYMASTMTILYNVVCQTIKLFTGPDFTAMRWWFAVAGALGVGLAGFIAARLYGSWTAPTWSVILLGATSVTSIVFSQFADNFAFTALMTSAQVGVYLWLVRGRWRWPGFLLFAVIAYWMQLGMYTQFLVTAGLFLAALVEITRWSRSLKSYTAWLFSVVMYTGLSFLHFYATFLVIPHDEPFRWYMYRYYPLALLGKGVATGGWDGIWFGYYLFRLYDLFNYHWSLVFNPRIYLPLQWNWVSLPFLTVVFAAVICWIILLLKSRRIKQSAISSPDEMQSGSPLGSFDQSAQGDKPAVDNRFRIRDQRLPGNGLVLILIATLVCHMLANRFLFITFGGTRQCVYLAPLFWLAYGAAVNRIMGAYRNRKGTVARVFAFALVGLTLLPFALSWPGLYRERVSRVDLEAMIEAIRRYRPEKILASHDSIQAIQLTMMHDPRFTDVHWPGYPYESDMLDADLSRERPYVSFTLNGEKYALELVEREIFPRKGTNLLYLDTFLAFDARYEGPELLKFYTPLDEMTGPDQEVVPLVEKPGNTPNTVHQSIYWPPNAFYMYRIVKE